ncbi:MAG: phosphatase [Cyclobacteriaceae bacterium]|jgi:exopolyphosphatase/guanosine-5'-triphosphate,3'-diphosphate pyrophosphatase|nr:phosphatase [Cytophagales bacterium]HNP77933.1 phosphatase [Cyclobacteriaceae bacterium]
MKLAAIDIGSNAIRFQVSSIMEHHDRIMFKKLEYVRFPLRLGHDVFTTNRISDASVLRFKKLMRAFKLLLELYEVDDFMICATSAMRESQNGAALVKEVFDEVGIQIHVIDGDLEAALINKAIDSYLTRKTYLHIDVGGGSTELNLFAGGKKIKTKSFKIGSVRMLEHRDSPAMWKKMEKWVNEIDHRKYGKVTAVGTGGNISKIFELAQVKPGKTMSISQVRAIRKRIAATSMEDRIYELQMNPDRADVIVPAGEIYLKVMEWAGSTQILVPEVGLKDGILLHLYETTHKKSKVEFFNTEDQSKGKKSFWLKDH